MEDALPEHPESHIYTKLRAQSVLFFQNTLKPYLNEYEGFYQSACEELLKTAKHYEDGEQAALELADREFASALQSPVSSNEESPAAELGPEWPVNPIHDPVDHMGTPRGTIESDVASIALSALGTITSPSGLLMELFNAFFGTNPLDWILDRFGDDWRPLSNAGAALQNIGDQVSESNQYQGDLAHLMGNPDDGWSGNAADAARGTFMQVWELGKDDAELLRDVGGQIDAYAMVGHQLAEASMQDASPSPSVAP